MPKRTRQVKARKSALAFWGGLLAGCLAPALFHQFVTDWRGGIHDRRAAAMTPIPIDEMVFHPLPSSPSNNATNAHGRRYHRHATNETLVGLMAERVRVHCWVMTTPANHETRARAVRATWAPRCNGYLFMSTFADPKLPSVALKVAAEGREHLWGKTKAAFRYMYEHHLEEYDWFLKADDDTYVIVENLRFLLMAHDPHNEAVYYGAKLGIYTPQGYMSGGGGYVLSRAALRAFIEKGLTAPNGTCSGEGEGGYEDVEVGLCLHAVGVKAGDSRDATGKHRFMPQTAEQHLAPDGVKETEWLHRVHAYPQQQGAGCCSDFAITFHYIPPEMMYTLEYLIYHLRPYGDDHELATKDGDDDKESVQTRLLRGYKDAVAEMGGDDVFKKNLSGIDALPAYLSLSHARKRKPQDD